MHSREKIIFVPFFDAFGGVERLVLHLSCYLHKHRLAHSVVCFSQSIDLASYADWPLKLRELRPQRQPLAEAWALSKYLREARDAGSPPALIFDLNGAFAAGPFAPAGYVLHLTDPPSLLPSDISKNAPSLHRHSPAESTVNRGSRLQLWRAEAVHRINKRGVGKAASVIVMTQSIAAEVSRLYNVSPQIVRPGVPVVVPQVLERQRFAALERGEPLRLLSVSRLEPNKRIDWILQALSRLPSVVSETKNWVLDVVGVGSQADALKDLSVQLGIESQVCFHGMVDDEKLRAIYADAHFFLMPAVQGYGLPALEALTAGLPVILHQESGVAEILSHTPWAHCINSTPNSLELAIDAMMERLLAGEFQRLPRFGVPTAQAWAEQICQVCGWIPNV